MGARNALAALAMYPGLPHGPMRLLLGMALTALDETNDERPACRYFGGESALAEILGGPSKRSRVYEGLKRLDEAGAVTRIVQGRTGKRAVYQLHVDPLTGPASRKAGGSCVPESGTSSVPETGSLGVPESGTPRRTKEPLEEIKREDNSSFATTSLAGLPTDEDDAETKYLAGVERLEAEHGKAQATTAVVSLMSARDVDRHEAVELLVKELELT